MGFKSIFQKEMEDYLKLRKQATCTATYKSTQYTLQSFDEYLAMYHDGSKSVSMENVYGWIRTLYSSSYADKTIVGKVSELRKFLEYLRFVGFLVFMPDCPKLRDDYIPYIFSDIEISKIFHAADSILLTRNSSRYIQLEFPMLLRILYCCGLRLNEALTMRVNDILFENSVLIIRNAKNQKQRLVPMAQELTDILEKYCLVMRIKDRPDAFLFPGKNLEGHLSKNTALKRFQAVLKSIGIYVEPAPHTRGQCLHCFRHLFAIKSFAQAESNGCPADESIPYLSVYMGHEDMNGTAKYLKFSSDIFPEYTEMFEVYTDGIFSEVSYEE